MAMATLLIYPAFKHMCGGLLVVEDSRATYSTVGVKGLT